MTALPRLYYEFSESVRIAWAQIRANKLRSVLTALGVIIGIVAVTLMGTAIRGIDTGFQASLAMLGDDVLYVQKWPWGPTEDWWNYVNRPPIVATDAEKLNRIIESTPNSLLQIAVPVAGRGSSVKAGDNRVDGIYVFGTTADYARISNVDYSEGRLFNELEADAGRSVCVLGYDVAEALFPGRSALGGLDPTLLEAAEDLGAPWWPAFCESLCRSPPRGWWPDPFWFSSPPSAPSSPRICWVAPAP